MKKFLFSIALAAISLASVQAQSTKLVSKSITAVDTVTFANIPSKVKAFQYEFKKTSGTAAGLVILEGTITGTYEAIDTLTLSNVSTVQTKTVAITSTKYLSYRYRNTNTSSASGTVKAGYIRRTDE